MGNGQLGFSYSIGVGFACEKKLGRGLLEVSDPEVFNVVGEERWVALRLRLRAIVEYCVAI